MTASVSVVIPAHQAEALVADAIRSVLAQTKLASEIVVVDDGSTDGTCAVVESFEQVRLIRAEHRGAGAARNAGIAAATQPFVALLDADDIWAPSKLERQLGALEDPSIAVAFCWVQNTTAEGPSGEPMPAPLPSALLARREVFATVGPFDESLTIAEWPDWYLQMVEQGIVSTVVDEVLVERRLHGNNMGIQRRDEASTYARVLKASLDRRRAKAELS